MSKQGHRKGYIFRSGHKFFCVQILNHVEQGKRHANAVQVLPKGLLWDSVISLLKIIEVACNLGDLLGHLACAAF